MSPSYTLTASLSDAHTVEAGRPVIESWTLSCEKDGRILEQVPVVVDRGERVKVDLSTCVKRWNRLI